VYKRQGTQFIYYPDQEDPFKLPVILTRTPYNKRDPAQGQIEAVVGVCGIIQDMRGRYASGGTYMPMYADAWDKNAYYDVGHPLDITPNREANTHQDGYNTVEYIVNELRWDSNGDGEITPDDRLICNGKVGMFGASALGNSQYSAAAVKKIDPSKPGLKCLVPIVASANFYHCTGHQNGVYRERIIDGWLRGQVERYEWDTVSVDGSVYNNIHSLSDFGPNIRTGRDAAETAIDFWTTMNSAHYPNSDFRASMDVVAAPLDENGNPKKNGTVSRFTNFEVPIYHLTGWYDIFIDGQIETYQMICEHISRKNRNLQKLVIGPWAHQTIGSRASGDMRVMEDGSDFRYKENVGNVIGASLDQVDFNNIGGLVNSEAIAWFRYHLGNPKIRFPKLNEWQLMGQVLGSDVYIKIPAEDYDMTFEEFFNFINGTGPLPNFPISFKGLPLSDTNNVNRITIPATGNSFLGDRSGARMDPNNRKEFDSSKPNGVPNVRYYVAGPIKDGIPFNENVGNYWVAADTFPVSKVNNIPVENQKLYLHGDGTVTPFPPTTQEPSIVYLSDPNNPVPVHGGAEMISYTPDNEILSQGQMNFTDPRYVNQVLNRPSVVTDGFGNLFDLVKFETPAIQDSFMIAGVPVVTLYAKTRPLSSVAADKSNVDFIVRILDVYPDGRELFVQDAAVNARAREYAKFWAENGVENKDIAWDNVNSDQILEYKFRMLPIAYTWGRGHKIKVLISGSCYPRFQACPNVPLNAGEFFRRRPYEDKAYVYNGQALFPRKTVPVSYTHLRAHET
jgi:predicted acyl esterase